jgi:hypothetical protein
LKALTESSTENGAVSLAQGMLIAILATLTIVIGFARKTASQSFVSVEDFWGGALIGITVGFVGHSQFLHLFGTAQT